jgi:hypothetical protein
LRRVIGFREEHAVIASRLFLGAHAAWLKKEIDPNNCQYWKCFVSKGNDDKGEEGFGRTFGLLAVSAGFTSGAGALAVSKGKVH